MGGIAGATVRNAEWWLDEGRRLIGDGNLAEAEACFRQAVQINPNPAALNNLALVQLEHRSNPVAALQTIAPNLESASPQPYAHGLAARCHARLGDSVAAQQHLRMSIDAFQSVVAQATHTADINRLALCEYTAIILQAAGDLDDDRGVWELYQRWRELHVLPVSHFYGGVAAFNRGRFTQAARVWRQVVHPGWEFLAAYATLAELFAAGTIPPLRLRYATPCVNDLEAAIADPQRTPAEKVIARLATDPTNLMMLLHLVFTRDPRDLSGTEKGRVVVITALVAGSGEWGQRLARSLFASARVPTEWKIAALEGMHKAGSVMLGEPVSMLIDGERRDVALKRVEMIVDLEPAMEQRHRAALALRDEGKVHEARRMLAEFTQGDRLYAPGIVTYANVLRGQGELAEARRWLELLHDVSPDHPIVLCNLAGLCAQEGDTEGARQYLDAVDIDDLPADLAEKVAEFALSIDPQFLADYAVERLQEDLRRQIDERPLMPHTPSLRRALEQIPVEWLNVACRVHGISSQARLRCDRAQQLADSLLGHPDAALQALARVDPDGRAQRLLRFLVGKGGHARAGEVTRKFGSEQGDGYYWSEQSPVSPLGLLRMTCLAFVGRAPTDGRRVKVVVVPADLCATLVPVLAREPAGAANVPAVE